MVACCPQTLCEMLRFDRRAVRRSLALGAFGLLLLQLSWSTLGIALVPHLPTGGRVDPVDLLLAAGGPIAALTAAVGACAVTTTMVGTNAALRTFWADATRRPRLRTGGLALSLLLPALAAATSRTALFRALDFAGAYPVTLLWGVLPPMMALRNRSAKGGGAHSARPLSLAALALLSAIFLGWNAWSDLGRVLGRSALPTRWS